MHSSYSKKPEFSLNLFKIVEDYFDRMLEEVSGMKCLVLDKETTVIISLICSQSQILKKNVYLIETIENPSKEKLLHLNAIYFVRPTEENITKLIAEIKERRFNEYNIFFSNAVSNLHLEKLAVEDDKNSIKKIIEVYSDFYVMNQDLFSLNILNSSGFRKSPNDWKPVEETLFERMTAGVASLCFALRRIPYVRFQTNSAVCERLAAKLFERFQSELKESPNSFNQSKTKSVLILLERREDPITPLLTQWTYQAMLHELLGIKNNRIDLSHDKNYSSKDQADCEFVISSHTDHFFADHMYEDFGDFAESVKKELDDYSSVRKKNEKIESLNDMQKVLDSIPELKKKSTNISKHVTLTSELSKLVTERNLIDISKLEQEMTVKDNKNEHFKGVMDLLGKPYDKFDKLKLAIIYCLRYEDDQPTITLVKSKLKEEGLSTEFIDIIDYVIKYAGKNQRVGDLFATRDIVNKLKKNIKQVFKDVPNIFTQHEPYICTIIDALKNAKLKESEFACKSTYKAGEKPSEIKADEIIIFFVGGVTYEEAKAVADLNKKGANIIIGGTNVINSKLFLGEITDFEKEAKDVYLNFNPSSGNEISSIRKMPPGYNKLE